MSECSFLINNFNQRHNKYKYPDSLKIHQFHRERLNIHILAMQLARGVANRGDCNPHVTWLERSPPLYPASLQRATRRSVFQYQTPTPRSIVHRPTTGLIVAQLRREGFDGTGMIMGAWINTGWRSNHPPILTRPFRQPILRDVSLTLAEVVRVFFPPRRPAAPFPNDRRDSWQRTIPLVIILINYRAGSMALPVRITPRYLIGGPWQYSPSGRVHVTLNGLETRALQTGTSCHGREKGRGGGKKKWFPRDWIWVSRNERSVESREPITSKKHSPREWIRKINACGP